MFHFTEQEIDYLIQEDLPSFDLTTSLLPIGEMPAVIRFKTRDRVLVSSTEEALRITKRFELQTGLFTPSGTLLESGSPILEAKGSAASVHAVWRLILNILEYASGIATRTHGILAEARRENPDVQLVTTRKSPPGMRKIAMKAVMAGGGMIHRPGLSETILIFKEHVTFLGGEKELADAIRTIKKRAGEKKVTVEVHSVEEALKAAEAGADVIQTDKLTPALVTEAVRLLEKSHPGIPVAAAGGIRRENAAEYGASGAQFLVTSSPYSGPPADLGVEILREGQG